MYDSTGLSMNSLAAQAFVFFLAGFETSSTTMTFCLYELSVNPEIQELLLTEIDTVLEKHDGKLSYEAVQEMTYLDKVVSGRAKGTTFFPNVVCVSYYRLVLERFTSVSLSHSEVMARD
jgi:cytochrome P450 family 6